MSDRHEPDEARAALAMRAETTRGATVRAESFNEEDNSVEVEFAAGATVTKYDWRTDTLYLEALPLDRLDLSELNTGSHVLKAHNHDVDQIIGSVVPGTGRVEDGVAVARIMLSTEPEDASIVNKIRAKIIRKWSFGYERVGPYETSKDEATGLQIRLWPKYVANEISPVPVPADGFTDTRARQETPAHQEEEMSEPTKTEGTRSDPVADEAAVQAARDEGTVEGTREGAQAEATRQTDIRTAASLMGEPDESRDAMLADLKMTADAARVAMINARAERDKGTETQGAQHAEAGGQDEGDTRVKAITAALEVRMGISTEADLPEYAKDLRGASILDIAAARLQLSGIRTSGRTRQEIAEMALHSGTRGAHTTSDFPYLTANVLNKVLQDEREVIADYRWFEKIAARNDFNDFKTRSYVSLKGLGLLPIVPEGADYESITLAEGHESMIAVKRGAEFPLTMELMVNDELGGLLRLVRKFGRSSVITQSYICAALLSAQLMSDGELVCSAAHSNLSASGGAPDVNKLDELDGFLRDQTDGADEVIGLPGAFLLLPGTWRKATEQLFSAHYKPTAAANALTVDIPKERRIYIPSLAGTNPWYMGTGDTTAMEYGYLAGDGGPVITSYQEEKSDALVYHGRLVFGAGVIDYQAFASNPGA